MILTRLLLFLSCFWIFQSIAEEAQPDYEREQRIAQQIEPQIFDGDAVWLNDGNREFLTIHMEADEPKGSVLILHGRDVNPEDQNVVGPVRVHLAENGWSTLAIQLPVLEKGKTYYDYLPILKFAHPRIEAAIDYLRQNGEETIIVASHSCGAHMTNSWINASNQQSIQGYIAMGVGATDAGQKLQTPFPFANMTVPILDIYGTDEFPGPLSMVDDRLDLLKKNGHPATTQIAMEGADHYFHDMGGELAQQILTWLNDTNF
jgi:pimeloyl-ACP methyl ester carboxylesterase